MSQLNQQDYSPTHTLDFSSYRDYSDQRNQNNSNYNFKIENTLNNLQQSPITKTNKKSIQPREFENSFAECVPTHNQINKNIIQIHPIVVNPNGNPTNKENETSRFENNPKYSNIHEQKINHSGLEGDFYPFSLDVSQGATENCNFTFHNQKQNEISKIRSNSALNSIGAPGLQHHYRQVSTTATTSITNQSNRGNEYFEKVERPIVNPSALVNNSISTDRSKKKIFDNSQANISGILNTSSFSDRSSEMIPPQQSPLANIQFNNQFRERLSVGGLNNTSTERSRSVHVLPTSNQPNMTMINSVMNQAVLANSQISPIKTMLPPSNTPMVQNFPAGSVHQGGQRTGSNQLQVYNMNELTESNYQQLRNCNSEKSFLPQVSAQKPHMLLESKNNNFNMIMQHSPAIVQDTLTASSNKQSSQKKENQSRSLSANQVTLSSSQNQHLNVLGQSSSNSRSSSAVQNNAVGIPHSGISLVSNIHNINNHSSNQSPSPIKKLPSLQQNKTINNESIVISSNNAIHNPAPQGIFNTSIINQNHSTVSQKLNLLDSTVMSNNRPSMDSNTHKILILIEENEKLIRINEELMKENKNWKSKRDQVQSNLRSQQQEVDELNREIGNQQSQLIQFERENQKLVEQMKQSESLLLELRQRLGEETFKSSESIEASHRTGEKIRELEEFVNKLISENTKLVEIVERNQQVHNQEIKVIKSAASERESVIDQKDLEISSLHRQLEDLKIQSKHGQVEKSECQGNINQLRRELQKQKIEQNQLKSELENIRSEAQYTSKTLSCDIQKYEQEKAAASRRIHELETKIQLLVDDLTKLNGSLALRLDEIETMKVKYRGELSEKEKEIVILTHKEEREKQSQNFQIQDLKKNLERERLCQKQEVSDMARKFESEKQNFESRVNELEADLRKLRNSKDNHNQDLQDREEEMKKKYRELDKKYNGVIAQQESQINSLTNQVDRFKEQSETLKNKLIFMQNNHEVEIKELQHTYIKAHDSINGEVNNYQELVQELENNLSNAQSMCMNYQNEIQRLQQITEEQTFDFESTYMNNIENTRLTYEKRLEQAYYETSCAQNQLQSVLRNNEIEVSRLNEELENYKAELDKVKRKTNQELIRINASMEQNLKMAAQNHEHQITKMKAERDKEVRNLETELARVRRHQDMGKFVSYDAISNLNPYLNTNNNNSTIATNNQMNSINANNTLSIEPSSTKNSSLNYSDRGGNALDYQRGNNYYGFSNNQSQRHPGYSRGVQPHYNNDSLNSGAPHGAGLYTMDSKMINGVLFTQGGERYTETDRDPGKPMIGSQYYPGSSRNLHNSQSIQQQSNLMHNISTSNINVGQKNCPILEVDEGRTENSENIYGRAKNYEPNFFQQPLAPSSRSQVQRGNSLDKYKQPKVEELSMIMGEENREKKLFSADQYNSLKGGSTSRNANNNHTQVALSDISNFQNISDQGNYEGKNINSGRAILDENERRCQNIVEGNYPGPN